MSQTAVIVSLIVTVLLFIGAVLKNIDWREKAVKWVGNNPANSQHYIEAGDTVHTVEGHRILMAAEGMSYVYTDTDDETYLVDIPKGYPFKYIRGRRIIGQSDGCLVANPLGFFREDQQALVKEGLTVTSKLLEGNVLVKLIHSVKANSVKSYMTWILIVAVIAAAGYWWYTNNHKSNAVPVTNNVTQNSTFPVKPAITIIPRSDNGSLPLERTTP